MTDVEEYVLLSAPLEALSSGGVVLVQLVRDRDARGRIVGAFVHSATSSNSSRYIRALLIFTADRGRGLGRTALHLAIEDARAHSANGYVTWQVDAANELMLRLSTRCADASRTTSEGFVWFVSDPPGK